MRLPLCLLATLVLARVILDVGQPPVADDIWWHVALGRSFIEGAGFPAAEPLLFTSAGHPQFYHEWLFQVVVASLDARGGMGLLRACHVALVLVVLQQIYRFARLQNVTREIALAIALAAIFFAFQRLVQFRPHLFSMIFFYTALNLYCVPRFDWRRAVVLMVVVALWANSHATVMLLFPFLIIYLVVDGQRMVLRSRSHLLGLLGALGAVALNPQGLRTFVFYFIHDRNNALTRVVDEWGKISVKPQGLDRILPWSSPMLLAGFALVAVGVLWVAWSYLRRREAYRTLVKRDFHLLIWGVLAIIASAWAVRFLWLLPLALVLIARALATDRWSIGGRMAVATLALLCIFAHQLSAGTAGYRYQLNRGAMFANVPGELPRVRLPGFVAQALSASGYELPILTWLAFDAVQFKHQPLAFEAIAASGYIGNLYTPYHLGGYAAYTLLPQVKAFYNGRYDGYSRAVYDDSFRMLAGGSAALEIVERYAIDSFLLLLGRDSYKLVYTLKLRGWCEGFHDEQAIWLVAPQVLRDAGAETCPSMGHDSANTLGSSGGSDPTAAIVAAVRHHRLQDATALALAASPHNLPTGIVAALDELCAIHRRVAASVGVTPSADARELCEFTSDGKPSDTERVQ